MRWVAHVAMIPLFLALSRAAAAPPPPDPGEEARIALSAAPPHVRVEAGVYVLGEEGYQLVRPSANGFHCLIERWDGDPAPICYDRVGSESTHLVVLYLEARRAEGGDDAVVFAEIDEGYASGRFRTPAGQGIAYMLSEEGPAPPHVMYYAPYMMNAEVAGAVGAHRRALPFVYDEGSPRAYLVQLVDPDFVRGLGGGQPLTSPGSGR